MTSSSDTGAAVCVGAVRPHPQWILPHGGTVTVDGENQRVWADYN